MTLSGATYKTRPGTDTTNKDATTDQCLASIVTSSFTRIAAKESAPDRVGFEYYGSQSLGNYVQWPGMEDCAEYDPRYRPWYAAAASGPKDVVLVIDCSGSMAGELNRMAKAAATMVVDTLTSADYVAVIKYSGRASAYTPTLVQATDETKTNLKAWIASNIDAAGTTNFRAAFSKAWEVVDATSSSSSCNRVMLFLSDGDPNDWDDSDYESVAAKSASYSPPMHVLTYGLGDRANPTVLKGIACQNAGIYYSATASTISDTMAGYYQLLAPKLSPCKLRWVLYNDYYTGQELLGACLASFELESAGSATSCNGGLSGLGDNGDFRVPKLIGVSCVDMNLVVDLTTLRARSGWNDSLDSDGEPISRGFWSTVQSEMTACPRLSVSESQMETLRFEAGGESAVCDIAEYYVSRPSPPSPPSEDVPVGTIAGIAVALLLLGGLGFCIYKRASGLSTAAGGQPSAPTTAQPGAYGAGAYGTAPPQQQMQMGAVPVCQGSVVQAAPAPQAYGVTAGYAQPVAQPQVEVQMGQVIG